MYNEATANVKELYDAETRPYYTQRLNAEQIAEVEQRALKRGIEQGELQHTIKIAHQLFHFGMSYEQIAQATELDLDFVCELAAQARAVE